MKPIPDTSSLDSLFEQIRTVNIVTPSPREVCEYLVNNKYTNAVHTSSGEMVNEMIRAVMTNKADKFRSKYCEAPVFILNAAEQDLMKDSFGNEVILILSVRYYKHLPTVFVSEKAVSSFDRINPFIASLMLPTETIEL